MGNSHPKFEYSLLTEAEKPIVIESFKCMSKDSKKIKRSKIRKFWDMQVDPSFMPLIENFLFGKEQKVGFQKFAGLFVFSIRGTIEEKILTLKMSMPPTKKKKNEVIEINRTFVKEVSMLTFL
jgi:hypothetical protein